jgi:hypothetical protein
MSQNPSNAARDTEAPESMISAGPVTSVPTDTTRELDEYKLAVQIQQNYHEVALKSITIMVAITAISLGFVFRESVSIPLKVTFCWFNLAFSLFFSLCFLGFFIILRRIARRMDMLACKLSFSLRNHYALSYGVFLTLVSSVGLFIFWIVAIIFRLWNVGVQTPTAARGTSLFLFAGLASQIGR